MSFEQISDIVACAAQELEALGVRCTPSQLQPCITAFARLQELTSSPVMTLAIFDELVAQTTTQTEPWDWVATELRFEVHVVALGSRTEAALSCLRYRTQLSDALLDTYNERIRRFAHLTPLLD